jgi:16S rRNA (cytidine1402-2'-O)-methyltransferase
LNDSPDRRAPGVLYVVATPIGNLEDVSARALRVLGEVDIIACEDTRHSARLLSTYSIRTPTISYFEHNEERRTPELIERLQRGESVALVTDAGTPAISDPGYRLVRAALAEGIRVAALPGPSAAVAAISISGLPTDRFTFEGFLPQKASARRNALEALKREPRTMVFFEAARRLTATLGDMESVFGREREAVVVREITKTFEESVRGTVSELRTHFTAVEPRGEIVIVVAGASAPSTTGVSSPEAHTLTVEELCDAGLSLKDASIVIARLTGTSRREVYQQALARRNTD